jgi:predicted Zn-dependent protease
MHKEDKVLKLIEQDLTELTATQMGRRAFLASLPLLLAACATPEKTRYREGSNKGQKTSLTVKDEIKMTKEYLPQMQKEYPPTKDPFLRNYIDKLGQKIVMANNLHHKPYTYNFNVVDTKVVNAFALPAGTIFVTAPLIAMADSEAELAGVIGHEIGHVQARHTAERIDKAQEEQKKSVLYGAGGAVLGGLAGFGLGKLICQPKDQECLGRIAKYGAGAGIAGGLLIQKFAFMANSREDEMEADRIGFRTSVAAGFHKDHVGNFYEKLLEMEQKYSNNKNSVLSGLTDAMSTHPPSKERVAQMKAMAKKETVKPNMQITSDEFIEAKKRVGPLKS